MSSRTGAVARFVVFDLFGSLIWFPVWWYTTGFARVSGAAIRTIRFRSLEYGFAIWVKNFFVPMYGQYDITGRIVSVFMRFVVLIGRLLAIIGECVLYIVGIIAYACAPPMFLAMAIINLTRGI